MAENALTLARIGWVFGDTKTLLDAFSSEFIKMPTVVGRNIKYGYWETHVPHYLLIASHDTAYERPAHVQGADYNFLLTITSRDDTLNHRVLAEFSGKVHLQALREPRSDFLRRMLQNMSFAYPAFEKHGVRAFDALK